MLFYNQVKREFPQATWKKGQQFFSEKRLRQVHLDGDRVTAQIRGVEKQNVDTAIVIARGTIASSQCSCREKSVARKHCEHVAALCIYVVERGSLLRSGIADPDLDFSSRADTDEDAEEEAPRAVPAEAVAFVRGMFQGKVLNAVSIEAAISYKDPDTGEKVVKPVNRLIRQLEFKTWRTVDGTFLKVYDESVPILENLDAAILMYQGQASLEALARVLDSPQRRKFVLHDSIDILYDPEPLKLVSLRVGSKTEKSRKLTYEFRNSSASFLSDELAELSRLGRLSSNFVWRENCLYRFETSLATLSQYANRSGIAATESPKAAFSHDGFGYLYDDPEHPLHPLAAYRLSLELGVDNFVVDPDWKEFHDWKKVFERKKIPTLPEVEFGYELRDYQKNGLSWLWSLYHRGLSSLLADDMGLGKTHQVMAYLSSLYCVGAGSKVKRAALPSLVIAPTSVVAAWAQKLNKYETGLRWHVFHGQGRKLPPARGVDLVLTTYGILQREPALRERPWHTVILDEAQAVKNASTISSRAARMISSQFRIAMTGTPVENQPADLWSIMEFLLPGYLGSLPRFKRLYGAGREAPSREKAEALRRLVSPFLLRRTKAQVLTELPEKTEEVIYCEMTPVQRKAYRDQLSSADAARIRQSLEGGGKVDYANILALLTRLKQICDHPQLVNLTGGRTKPLSSIDLMQSGKWETFEELVNEALGSDLKIVVFTQYLGMMDLIGHYLKGKQIGFTELRGDTTDRAERLDRFASDPECKIFVCSLLAGGLGIDLTSASVCIHMDRWWNPAKENQATDRLHRIGQTRGVQVFKLQVPGTVEDRIAEIIQSKKALSGALIEESPVGLKAFSREELLELFTPME